ncbi:MAG: MFS transporter [Chloroflexota bacterium]
MKKQSITHPPKEIQQKVIENKRPFSIWAIVGFGFVLRLLIDTSGQLFYPFVPVFAAGLGVSAVVVGRLISIQSLIGLVSPIFGNLADKYGYRPFMRLGLAAVGIGMIVFASGSSFAFAVIGAMILGFGFSLFTPNLLAYLSANLPAERRSRGMGAVELSWGLAGIIGVTPLGFAIARWGWRSPLIGLGVVLIAASFLPILFPKTKQLRPEATTAVSKPNISRWAQLKRFLDLGENRGAAWAAIMGTGFVSFASSHLLSSYGQWLFVEYGLGSDGLGRIAGIIGLGGFTAILLISTFGDRIGSLLGSKIGAFGAIFAFLLLPLINLNLTWLVVGLFILYFFYQFTIVNAIILTSVQIPSQRGKMMTLGWALDTIMISLANITGPTAFATFGPWGLAIPSGITMLILWLILLKLGGPGGEEA